MLPGQKKRCFQQLCLKLKKFCFRKLPLCFEKWAWEESDLLLIGVNDVSWPLDYKPQLAHQLTVHTSRDLQSLLNITDPPKTGHVWRVN